MPPLPLKVLIIDDNAGDRNLERIALEAQCFVCAIDSVRDIDAAKEYFAKATEGGKASGVDLVLMDGHLCGELATTLIDHLKAIEALRAIPIVVLTGSSSDEEHREFLRHGAHLVIEKTTEIDDLIAALAVLEDLMPRPRQ
jgi:CheY-like chemotaxis protein